jgi:hypothetical protein
MMIRTTLTLTALSAFMGISSAATQVAAPADNVELAAPAVDSIKGTVEAIDREGNSFTLMVGEERQTIKLNKETAYYLDGNVSTRDLVLKVGASITVAHADRTATRIDGVAEKG